MRKVMRWVMGIAWVHAFCQVAPAGADPAVHPEDLHYLGAFRMPTEGYVLQGQWTDMFSWCKGIEAYYPDGDPGGDADGFPGSLFGIGHDWVTPMYEITIPAPVNSKNLDDLPVAQVIQHPTGILGGLGSTDDLLKGIEYLPAQGSMTEGKLHVSFGKHYQYNRRTTHGWISLDLANPNPAGPWYVGTESQVSDLNTNEYIFTIPERWANEHVGGMRLACGRHREGQVATGPSIVAYAPWMDGNPPPPNTELTADLLVHYKDLSLEDGIDGHCWADSWDGAAWLDNGEKSAAIIVGERGFGNCWYGWRDGTTPEECATWPGGCEANGYGGSNRGYWADYFRTVILFYSPDDLARVAGHQMTTWDIQPYLVWDITPYMIEPESTYEIHTGGVAFDAEHGYLYVTEKYGDDGRRKPVIHVFSLAPALHTDEAVPQPDPTVLTPPTVDGSSAAQAPTVRSLEVAVSMDRGQRIAAIHVADPVPSSSHHVTVHDISGRLVDDLGSTTADTITWSTRDVRGGVYFVRVKGADQVATRKVVVVN